MSTDGKPQGQDPWPGKNISRSTKISKFRVGLVGYGYWGPNLARNFRVHPDCQLTRISDKDPLRRRQAQKDHPTCEVVSDARDVTKAPDIDIVLISTPTSMHHDLAIEAMENGKHVWIEKPMAASVRQAEKIVEVAARTKRCVIVDHTFLFTGAVQKMKDLIERGILGNLYCYDSVRVNLGLFQHDVNVIWDLAPHDISIMDFLVPHLKPQAVNAVGTGHFKKGLQDVAYLTVKFQNNFLAHFHTSWISPVKIRKTLVAGDKKMLVWDDLENDAKIKIYDNGVEMKTKEGVYKSLVQYRLGDMLVPRILPGEALESETKYFIDCIQKNIQPLNGSLAGLRVVKILEASDKSMRAGGKEIRL